MTRPGRRGRLVSADPRARPGATDFPVRLGLLGLRGIAALTERLVGPGRMERRAGMGATGCPACLARLVRKASTARTGAMALDGKDGVDGLGFDRHVDESR